MNAPEERFSNRVEAYVKHRPTYPVEAIETLRVECGLGAGSAVADIGAGTGIFSALLLDAGWRVAGVEPNEKMRRAAEERLGGRAGFVSVDGTAEKTGLAEASVELVTAAQAFHWFRVEEARREFARILRPGGWVALIWNHRAADTAFQKDYEKLLVSYLPEYVKSRHRDVDEAAVEKFFGEGGCRCFTFPSEQRFDFAGLKGRLESSSYAPTPERAEYAPLMRELEAVFARYASEGRVVFGYETRLFIGRLGE
ncbi:MAG: class I SAM-dependent methyltransferase [Verrucomicrobiota bacterium]